MIKIAPSILSADFSCLGEDIKKAELGGADWLHIDVMDGHFVPNITIGAPVLKSIKPETSLFCDVHLMIENPEQYIKSFINAGADCITVHQEACVHLHRVIQMIKEESGEKVMAGVAINPATPLVVLEEILPDVDLILIMSVNPGFGGQKYISSSTAKIKRLKQMIINSRANTVIEVDGGINTDTIRDAVLAGVDVAVAGSAVFGKRDIALAIKQLKEKANCNDC